MLGVIAKTPCAEGTRKVWRKVVLVPLATGPRKARGRYAEGFAEGVAEAILTSAAKVS